MKKYLVRAVTGLGASVIALCPLVASAAPGVPAPAAFVTSADPKWGINDPACVPTGKVTEPVVLLHGTSDNASVWKELVGALKDQGMCVWAFDYGADDVTLQNAIPSLKAIGDLDASAREIASQVAYVRRVTGAQRVNLVGHSQGGMHTKTYEQMYGDPGTVARVVAIGGNYHGTTLDGAVSWLGPIIAGAPGLASFLVSTAAIQQVVGSPFITKLNALPDTSSGVRYTSIYSPADKTVTPNSTSMLQAQPGADVVNVDLGKVCNSTPRHENLPHDAAAVAQIVWGLTRQNGEQPTADHCR